eukprot:5267135-Prymnesium_polylepis.1
MHSLLSRDHRRARAGRCTSERQTGASCSSSPPHTPRCSMSPVDAAEALRKRERDALVARLLEERKQQLEQAKREVQEQQR